MAESIRFFRRTLQDRFNKGWILLIIHDDGTKEVIKDSDALDNSLVYELEDYIKSLSTGVVSVSAPSFNGVEIQFLNTKYSFVLELLKRTGVEL